MNTLDGNVIVLHPATRGGELWLALGIGNGARQAAGALCAAEEACGALSGHAGALDPWAEDLSELSHDIEELVKRLDRCAALGREMAALSY
jgi:hypothetical protein